ncbi:unnamed protein product [Brassicogethes aeneus]|uniref:Glucosylceramidase n=1 Tax=Brassicogethes aeneus TaxID=1431903 RepID=A0A9P0AWT3_BRAAE|nr:unnamed protein product [Brassicogethes aeneus]
MNTQAVLSLLTIFLCLLHLYLANDECVSKDFGYGSTVCVCNKSTCHSVPPLQKPKKGQYVIYTSNKEGLRLHKGVGNLVASSTNYKEKNVLKIDEDVLLQEMKGFGGAFTDANGINLASLTKDMQEKLIKSYFTEDGIQYSLCRIPIGGTDFSTHAYSYCDTEEPDKKLTHFKLAEEDHKYKIPYALWAKNLTQDLKFFASAWTAPKWMKINGNYSGPMGFLKYEFYQTWAEYHLKFLEAYEREGIDFWGMTTGNEPVQALSTSKINSVAWLPWQMLNYVKNNLGPTIKHSKFSKIHLMMLDDMRFFLPWYTNWVMKDKKARKYLDGIAVHWYFDDQFSPNLLNKAHNSHPDKFIINTEACNGDQTGDIHVMLGSWERGEKYGSSIIEDTNHWVTGWIDWNMCLDIQGGPTYIDNNVDSPIIVNATANEFYKQPMYYVLGHFSKFIPIGSHKINSTQIDNKNVPVATFKRPDGGVVTIILNKKEVNVDLVLINNKKGDVPLTVSPKSITTVVYYN